MNYLRRQTDRNVILLKREDFLASQVCRSVERNFNGYENMGIVCSVFCPKVSSSVCEGFLDIHVHT